MEKLLKIQTSIKVLKNIWNDFGKYYYRSAESILKAVKPFLVELKCTLKLEDEVVCIGNHNYVKATATLKDLETGEQETASAYAKEPESKKGMDDSQLTGSTSSYARKYALNGLLLLDDGKDSDKKLENEEDELEKHKGEQNYKNMRILEIINGTPIKLGQVKAWIERKYGTYIEFNKLSDEQFIEVTTALYKKLDSLMDE